MNPKMGYVGRFFPETWRPVSQEVAFAAAHGFDAIQFMNHPGLPSITKAVRIPLEEVRDELAAHNITATLEVNCRMRETGANLNGRTPLQQLEALLPFIVTLPCRHVHFHLFSAYELEETVARGIEEAMVEQFATAVYWGQEEGFDMAFEHNTPRNPLFRSPARCAALLEAVPGLGLVWDFNHTHPNDVAGYTALAPRITLAHVSDTPLPELNHHLPLGMGTVPTTDYCAALMAHEQPRYLILEIGGLPVSGGYGRDSDEALLESRERLLTAFAPTRK